MEILAHETGDSDGYLKVSSPDGKSFAEFKGLRQIDKASFTRAPLCVNGRSVSTEKCADFSPSCTWSPDSNFLILMHWFDGYYPDYTIYDARSETLIPVLGKNGERVYCGFTIKGFQWVVEDIERKGKINLYDMLDGFHKFKHLNLNSKFNPPIQSEPKSQSYTKWLAGILAVLAVIGRLN